MNILSNIKNINIMSIMSIMNIMNFIDTMNIMNIWIIENIMNFMNIMNIKDIMTTMTTTACAVLSSFFVLNKYISNTFVCSTHASAHCNMCLIPICFYHNGGCYPGVWKEGLLPPTLPHLWDTSPDISTTPSHTPLPSPTLPSL